MQVAIVVLLAILIALVGTWLWRMRDLARRQGEEVQRHISPSLDEVKNVTNQLARGLGELQERSQQVQKATQEIVALQELLRPPKLRGGVGELLLERLLEQVIPRGHYATQFSFQDGTRVDAVVLMQDRKVPIDSKFPLESFTRIIDAQTEDEIRRRRREFDRVIRNHIDSVAGYIRPAEGTFEFGLMYIPAENIYYELVIKRGDAEFDLHRYALDKNVIPVSPNTLYLYLHTVALGLMGLQLQEKAQEVWGLLSALTRDFQQLMESDFRVLGRHLKNAQDKYDDTRRRLERLETRLTAARQLPQAPGAVEMLEEAGTEALPPAELLSSSERAEAE